MVKKRLLIAAVAAMLAIALVAASALICAALSVGSKAPDFKLDEFNGGTIRLSDYTNKPTVLVFWASWCPHCVRELPVLDRLYKDLHPKGVNFVGVSLDRQISEGKDFVKSRRISFPIAAGKPATAESYKITGIPTIFVLGKGGVVKARYAGAASESTIRSDLSKLGIK